MNYKRLLTSMLTISMLASTAVPAFAAEPNEVTDPLPSTGYTKITVEVKDSSGGGETPDIPPVDPTDIIIATVPVELPIIMDLEGNITVPTDATIINHVEDKGIKVTDISVTLDSSWTAANFTDDFSTKADDTKEIGLSFRGDTLTADGTFPITDGNWNIAKNSNLPLNMAAKLPKQTTESKGQAATVGFTIGWSGLDGTDGGSDPDAGKDNSGGSGEVNPPEEATYTVSFTTDGNGTIEGDTSTTVKAGETITFPTAKPASIRYEHTGWVDTTTNNKIEPTTPITSDTTIKAVFSERAASPKNWFTSSNGTITGLSDEYLNMVDAPTDLVIPNNIGGSTIKTIGLGAFADKDLITSIVIPDTITTINQTAFDSSSVSQPNLTLDIPDSVTIIGKSTGSFVSPFRGRINKIIIGTYVENNFTTSRADERWSPFCGNTHVNTVVIRDGVTRIGNNCFCKAALSYTCDIKELYIPESVSDIGTNSLSGVDKVIINNSEENITWSSKIPDTTEVVYLK